MSKRMDTEKVISEIMDEVMKSYEIIDEDGAYCKHCFVYQDPTSARFDPSNHNDTCIVVKSHELHEHGY